MIRLENVTKIYRSRGRSTLVADRMNAVFPTGVSVGLLGRNGAGKSTMLKLISRITAPTKGEIRIRGRVASLLEIGTGFHRELSGRDNIYLNGAILGMNRAETTRKIDEIIDQDEHLSWLAEHKVGEISSLLKALPAAETAADCIRISVQ